MGILSPHSIAQGHGIVEGIGCRPLKFVYPYPLFIPCCGVDLVERDAGLHDIDEAEAFAGHCLLDRAAWWLGIPWQQTLRQGPGNCGAVEKIGDNPAVLHGRHHALGRGW